MSYINQIAIIRAPQSVTWTGMDDFGENREVYESLMKDSRKKVVAILPGDVTLYSAHNKMFIVDEDSEEVIYFVKYVRRTLYGKRSITQLQVWRRQTDARTETVSKTVFFDHLLPTADVIVTDQQQTKDGAFWLNRIAKAFALGYTVYAIDRVSNEIRILHNRKDFEAARASWYGEKAHYKARVFAIAKTPIFKPAPPFGGAK